MRETGAPWSDTSVNLRLNLLLKKSIYWDSNAASEISNTRSDKLGFQPSKKGRQQLPGLILQSITHETHETHET